MTNKDLKKIAKEIIGDSFHDVINANNNKQPIYKGCPNEGPCFCTGECREVIGYIDIEDLENYIKQNIEDNENK